MDRIEKKVREARFFLRKMAERERLAFGEHEEFDYFLSAFLSAGRSVDYRLRHEQGAAYNEFRATWDSLLTPDERSLVRALIDDRNFEIHESGSQRVQRSTSIHVFGEYSDASGRVQITAPPGTPPAKIRRPAYFFTVDGRQLPAVAACERYLGLLERMVKEYQTEKGL